MLASSCDELPKHETLPTASVLASAASLISAGGAIAVAVAAADGSGSGSGSGSGGVGVGVGVATSVCHEELGAVVL